MFVRFPPHLLHHRHFILLSTTCQKPWKVAPFLSCEMWVKYKCHRSLRNPDATASAPPLSRGMWAVSACSMEEWGREKHKGGPKEWEAHPVHPHNEPRWKLWFVFPFPRFFNPPDSVPDASAPNNDTDEDRSLWQQQHKSRGIPPLSGDGRNDKCGFNEAGEVPALWPHTGYQPHTPTNHTMPIDHPPHLSAMHIAYRPPTAQQRGVAPIDDT